MSLRSQPQSCRGCIWFRVIAFLLWNSLLVLLSLLPISIGPVLFAGQDKLAHLLFYAVAALLCCRLLAAFGLDIIKSCFVSIAYASLLGLLLEVLQGGMALGRQPELLDLLANTVGAGIGCGVFCLGVRLTSLRDGNDD